MALALPKPELRTSLLRLLRARKMHGYELLKTLQREGRPAHSSFLYGKLRELEGEGLVTSQTLAGKGGPSRRSYAITQQGEQWLKAKLEEAISTVVDFYADYASRIPLEDQLPKSSLLKHVKGSSNVIVLADFTSSILVGSIERLAGLMRRGTLYFVKPRELDVRLSSERTFVLEGGFSQIQLRDKLADLVLAMRPPQEELLGAIREFRRVLADGGHLLIIYPNTLIKQSFAQPLSFCDYIVWADQDYWKEQLVDEKDLMRLLGKYFSSIKKSHWMHFLMYEARA